jgi:hypothetical protein
MSRRRPRLLAVRRSVVPYGDLAPFRRPVMRTLALRIAVTAAAVALLSGAAVAAASSSSSRSGIVPKGTTSVVVIDLSKSIIDSEFEPIKATLRRLIATNTPTGLVVFSDVAYELLPPGTPARALVPLLRFFTPGHGGYPTNPWQANFRAGTKISAALDLAHNMLTQDGIEHGSIVLISDLETASSDAASLSDTLSQLKQEKVQLRVVPLRPSDQALHLFNSLLGHGYLVAKPDAVVFEPTATDSSPNGKLPVVLVVLGGLLLLALAANERWCARLAIGANPREASS